MRKAVAARAVPPLPPGCELLTDGTDGSLSPDGRLLLFARWRMITGERVPDAWKERFYDRGSEPLIPSLWVRDLETKSERPFPRWIPSGLGDESPEWHGLPISWAPGGTILLADGAILDPRTGAAVTTVLRPTQGAVSAAHSSEDDLRAWGWSADGRRLAYFGAVAAGQPGAERRAPFVMEAGGKAQRIDLTRPHDGKAPAWTSPGAYISGGRLAWSPEGGTLFLHLRFHRVIEGGPEEMEGVGLFFVRDDGVVVLGEFTALDGAPEARAGEQVWDAAGRHCVFVGAVTTRPAVAMDVYQGVGTETRRVKSARPWEGTMDVHVADREGRGLRRVTQDGVEKGQVCIDPAGRRVAFFVGEGAARAWGRADPKVRLRVVFLEGGRTWESQLAPPPDEWAPLGTLRWTPDGKRLIYTYEGIDGAVFAQEVPAGPP
jgi:hypothetical protein